MSDRVLASIGTTHPWNIAGVGLDAQVAYEYGLSHVIAIAAVSAQDRRGVSALHPIPAAVLTAQLQSLPAVNAIRIGALVAPDNVRAVAAYLRERDPLVPVVLDPVFAATLGGELCTDGLLGAVQEQLFSLPIIATPNRAEAQALAGAPVTDLADMQRAARALCRNGARAVLVTGGDLPGDPIDVLATERQLRVFEGGRLPGSMRGSGCTLAAAMACELAQGCELETAVARAREYVRGKIAARRMRYGLQVAF